VNFILRCDFFLPGDIEPQLGIVSGFRQMLAFWPGCTQQYDLSDLQQHTREKAMLMHDIGLKKPEIYWTTTRAWQTYSISWYNFPVGSADCRLACP
jgi:hypothetical protein